MPTIVGGDCNVRPQSLETWENISALGFVEAFQQHEAVHGVLLPPTCRSATRNDTLVYSWHFAQCFKRARVCDDGLFPDHSPLVVDFDVQVRSFVHRSLNLPAAMSDAVLRSDLFLFEQDKSALQIDPQKWTPSSAPDVDTSSTLEQLNKCLQDIGSAFESAYDRAVTGLNDFLGEGCALPTRQKERVPRLCPRYPKPIPPRQSPKSARCGAFEPRYEVYRLKTIQWVKQMRRLEAFSHRARKYVGSTMPPSVITQHQREWNAILASSGFRPSFATWVIRNGLCTLWPSFSSIEATWVADLCVSFRSWVNDLAWRESHERGKLFRHRVDLDLLHFGGSLSHALIKPPKPLPPGHFVLESSFQASFVRLRGKSRPTLQVSSESHPDVSLPCRYQGKAFHIQPTDTPGRYVSMDFPSYCPAKFEFSQPDFCTDPDRAAQAFFDFWAPFWLRDQGPHLVDLSAWPDFLQLCKSLPDLSVPDLDHHHTLQEWTWAIRHTKGGTARGVCGFSQPELASLSPSLLQLLVGLFNGASACGLPEWLMVARVVLVPKKPDASTFGDMRPITIYSLLFRIWAKVTAKRLLNQWKLVIPPCVVGGIPGRSCSRLSLQTALHHESGIRLSSEIGGFSLDITKCFNALPRLPAAHLLRLGGMGQRSGAFWTLSLGRMSRSACFMGTTGLPEGDPIAVCAIVMFGLLWASPLLSAGLACSLFYDDWSWNSSDSALHVMALRHTHDFLKALCLSSDPAKCWCWASSPKARKHWLSINEAVTGSPHTYRVSLSEKALGVLLHYSKQVNTGCQMERLESGVQRLLRLAKLPVSTEQKAHLIQSQVWPSALFGADIVYVGSKHFARLRSFAASVLVSKTTATSPFLALSVVSQHVVDPFLYLLLRTLGLWRVVSCKGTVDLLRSYLSSASDSPHEAFGPAGALRCYLAQIGWSVDSDGVIIDHLSRKVLLHRISFSQLATLVWDAWEVLVSQNVAKRHDFHDWPQIDLVSSRLLPLLDSPRELAVWYQQITLSHLWSTQNSRRVQNTGEDLRPCPLCQGEDSRAHFPLDCPGTLDLQTEYAGPVASTRLDFPHQVFLPLLYKHPKLDLLKTIHAARELPDAFVLSDFVDVLPGVPTFYTDGSCFLPVHPVARLAAFSVVLDSAPTDDIRRGVALAHRCSSDTPPTFVAVQVALVHGPQTVNRAEFSAVLQIVRSVSAARIFTDSAWTIATFEAVRPEPDPAMHCHRGNFDLILLLCELGETRDLFGFELVKIKSHLSNDEAPDDLFFYSVLGNRYADFLAGQGTLKERSEFHALAHEMAEWFLRQRSLLVDYRLFACACDILRLDGFKQLSAKPSAKCWKLTMEQLDGWDPGGQSRDIPQTVCPEKLQGYMPGASLLLCFLRWFRELRWPSEDTQSGGISHYELLFNFVGVTGSPLPRMVDRKVQRPEYRDPLKEDSALLLPLSTWDAVRLLEHTVTFARKILGVEVFPEDSKTQRTFLWRYGYKKQIAGVSIRPTLPMQSKHAEMMKTCLVDGQLKLPEPFDSASPVWRQLCDADFIPHAQRVRSWRSLDGHGRARK